MSYFLEQIDNADLYLSNNCKCSHCGKRALSAIDVTVKVTKRGDRWGTLMRIFAKCDNCSITQERVGWTAHAQPALPGLFDND